MRFSKSIALCALIAAAILAAPPPAVASENDSRTFFAQGRKLRAAGNCNDAITAFQRALDLWPQGLGALRNIAECEEQLGQYASARNSYWSLRRAALQSSDPNYVGWDKEAEAAYNKLAPMVAKITIKLEGASPEAVQVTIDGKPLDPRLVGVALERDLGPHDIEVRYGGVAPLTEKKTLVAGSNEVVTIKVPKAGATASPSASAPPTASASAEVSTFPYRPLAIGGFALGLAGLVGAGVSIGLRQSALGAIEQACPGYQDKNVICPGSLRAEKDTGVTASALVNVFAIAGVVGVGAGVTLLIASPSSRAPVKAELRLAPSPDGGMVLARGRF